MLQRISGVAGLRQEFERLKMYAPPNNSHEAFTANPTRNRYRDVPCLDVTRLHLLPSHITHYHYYCTYNGIGAMRDG